MNTIKIPTVLLPRDTVDMSAWAVNACDQYTSDYGYWRDVEEITKGKPSAYNLIFPEIYLKDQPEQRIERINKNMCEYLSGGIFKEENGIILVERSTPSGTRTGLIIAIDLEDYSYAVGNKALIRSTEATILERIPPRVEIRKNAPLELPHVMLLYDDSGNKVLNAVERGKVLYDFELMKNGGSVKGTKIGNPEEIVSLLYSLKNEDGLLFAVGDGNHSLATAKTCWENLKKTLTAEEREGHPSRYALVEAVNIYDGALTFEPIHRLVKTEKLKEFINGLKTSGGECAYIIVSGQKQKIPFNSNIPEGIRSLDGYIAEFGEEVDYIHGENDLINLTKSGGIGVLLPAIKKNEFFRLISEGVLPKKTFSMGEGYEKRYYIESRKIKG